MYRLVARNVLRSAARPSFAPAHTVAKRFASSSPVNTRRSWKSSAVRWGIAIAGIYYYNTSPVFAEQPQNYLLDPNVDALEDSSEVSSLDALTSHRQQQEAANEGAFNPETGEINWDCPCLGGMAHGPCGPEFREAFSCFVFSTEEPKGMDCIDKFQNMQQCFQRYPEIYKGELEDDEELDAELEAERQELVNEIAERKAQLQQREVASSRRLLEELDAEWEAEKQELANEVAERKAQFQQQEAAPTRRLLEEPDPAPSRSSRPAKKSTSHTPDKPAAREEPALSQDRENTNEGQKSIIIKQPQASPVEETASPTSDVVPRAAHDAKEGPETEK
ncbi:mitochondrial intermembrane space import and assembly protein 40 [Rhinocladiella mackenziei CBS 650.93]|uniref:Mitochondrial intermembrane space import and assembly protein 40 n=1 Tax=Rhinocladiella mackenziei CBS 650.93 TaxID=1442369 RepID=A0A0D2FTS4_9EURO|nr:mitochondrial intermembrane space import and assembly protein 40 [Rhinocladiella mackenziei CBS 650.93]KIX05482.1 mitochondrial intermembrane space import and assembly protein 40 [Rhinocladiella mackenziei CBS 650.93]